MNKRTEAAYKAIYAYIHQNVLNLESRFTMTDYELAMRKGLQAVLPTVELHGCHFHYSQAVHRRARKIPELLQPVYSKDEPLATKIYRTTGSVEAFNGSLGKNIPKRSHFFRFVRGLMRIDRDKVIKVNSLVESSGATAANKRSDSKVRFQDLKFIYYALLCSKFQS